MLFLFIIFLYEIVVFVCDVGLQLLLKIQNELLATKFFLVIELKMIETDKNIFLIALHDIYMFQNFTTHLRQGCNFILFMQIIQSIKTDKGFSFVEYFLHRVRIALEAITMQYANVLFGQGLCKERKNLISIVV